MDAVKFINETIRMCNFYRGECSKCCSNKSCMFCNLNAEDAAKKAVAIVEQWSAEHPQKTMLQDFLEKFPNATLHDNGTPYCCPHDLGYKKRDKCSLDDCVYCWNRPVEEDSNG